MSKMDFLVNVDKGKLESLASKHAGMLAHRIIDEHIGKMFKEGSYCTNNEPTPAGAARLMVEKLVDDLLLSNEYQKKIAEMAENMFKETLQKAVDKRVQHLMNKAAFEVDAKIKDTLDELHIKMNGSSSLPY
jgi:hypothetical protein